MSFIVDIMIYTNKKYTDKDLIELQNQFKDREDVEKVMVTVKDNNAEKQKQLLIEQDEWLEERGLI